MIEDSWNCGVVRCIWCDMRTGQPPLIFPPTFDCTVMHIGCTALFGVVFANAHHKVKEALMCCSINLVWQAGCMVHSSLSHSTAVIHHAARVLPAVVNDWWDLRIPSSALPSCSLCPDCWSWFWHEPMKLLRCSCCVANYCRPRYILLYIKSQFFWHLELWSYNMGQVPPTFLKKYLSK